jgi:excisionase family DNA binding protein
VSPIPGTIASLDVERLLQLVYMIRQTEETDSTSNAMQSRVNRLNVDKLLVAADIIRRCDIERLISVTEAAQLRGVSRQSIWKMLKSGTLTRYEVAGHTVIDRDELLVLPPRGELRLSTLRFKHMRKARQS